MNWDRLFARLGSEVTMIVRSRVLAKEDPEAAAVVRESLEADGVRILDHVSVQRATDAQGASRIHLVDGTFVEADTVLLAPGRTPRACQRRSLQRRSRPQPTHQHHDPEGHVHLSGAGRRRTDRNRE
ncbi:FAD-dependent oxidoreductase [Arthrobacter sp. A5]|uniref:FAD-dependent oxidoreductase n=1 Tax=Arthrobacter sp. A5 TaxID=576926 RepID=UPI003DAA3F1F